MPNVHIDFLTIEDFGPFYGSQTFDFSTKGNRSAILIGGKNGAGKTHLLRALYLATAGESGKADLRRVETGSEATKFVFERSLNRRAENEGKDTSRIEIGISLQDENGGGGRKIKLTREIRHRPNSSPTFISTAERDDDGQTIDSEQFIHKLRDAFLPRHLASFFFFDAERGQNIDLGQRDIVEGISRVLGLQSYTDLENDLRTLYQQKIPKVYNSASGESERRLMELTADIQKTDGYLKSYHDEEVSTEAQLQDVLADLVNVEDQLKTVGAVDPQEIERVQKRRLEITNTLKELERHLITAWDFSLPLALLGAYRHDLHEALESEERLRSWESARASVEPKIPQVRKDVFDGAPKEMKLDAPRLEFYRERLEKALLALFHPPPEGMAERAFLVERSDLSAQIRGKLLSFTGETRELAQICEKLETLDTEMREIDSRLRQLTQDRNAMELGNQLREQRGELVERKNTLERTLQNARTESATLKDRVGELKREESVLSEIVQKTKQGRTLGAIAQQYREAVAEIQQRSSIMLRGKISEYVSDLWLDIADRRHEFEKLSFDKEWNCWLHRRDGKKVAWDQINPSAGQRQVRLLAFTESLRRLARLTPPLVVDTPLGRLDKEVRESVLDTVYLGGHQSVILSTNAEIDPDGPLFDRVKKKLARVYTLKPYGDPGSADYRVTVQDNFFGRTI
jgi:DNA sulfur modification protein DndD